MSYLLLKYHLNHDFILFYPKKIKKDKDENLCVKQEIKYLESEKIQLTTEYNDLFEIDKETR